MITDNWEFLVIIFFSIFKIFEINQNEAWKWVYTVLIFDLTFLQILLQIGIDLISMERLNNGNSYICTVVDYFTKYIHAKAIPNKTAEEVAKFLFDLMMT